MSKIGQNLQLDFNEQSGIVDDVSDSIDLPIIKAKGLLINLLCYVTLHYCCLYIVYTMS